MNMTSLKGFKKKMPYKKQRDIFDYLTIQKYNEQYKKVQKADKFGIRLEINRTFSNIYKYHQEH